MFLELKMKTDTKLEDALILKLQYSIFVCKIINI